MEREAIGHLYGWIGGFLAVYTLSHWSVTQGGAAIESVPGLNPDSPLIGAYFAIVAIGLFLTLVGLLGSLFAWKAGPTDTLVPPVGLGGHTVEARTRLAVAHSAVVLLLVVFIPLAGLVHINRKLGGARVWNEWTPAGASLPAGCAFPRWWPFGNCDEPYRSIAVDLLEATGPSPDTQPERLWLANKACDLLREREMTGMEVAARKKDGGPTLTDAESTVLGTAIGMNSAVRQLQWVAPYVAPNGPASTFCSGKRDVSPACKKDDESCRGVEWRRAGSPVLVILPSLAGGLSAALYLGILASSALGRRGWDQSPGNHRRQSRRSRS